MSPASQGTLSEAVSVYLEPVFAGENACGAAKLIRKFSKNWHDEVQEMYKKEFKTLPFAASDWKFF